MVSALRDGYSKLQTIVGIDMDPGDEICDERWESLLTKWVNMGGWGMYNYSPTWDSLLEILSQEMDQEHLSLRIVNFLGGK